MTPAEMEALNAKYSNRCAIIVKLDDGGFAVFNNQRKLLDITYSMETVASLIENIETTCNLPPAPAKRGGGLTLEDLGL